MNTVHNSYVYEKLKIIIIILLNFSFFIIIESFLTLNSILNILKSPVFLIRYFPIVILLYYLINEILLLFNKEGFQNKISGGKDGLIFVPELFVWIAIFETHELNRVQKTELKQLRHLKIFSLELDFKKSCLRVFLYGDSSEELRLRIMKSKPILDVVLPNLISLSPEDSQKLFENEKFVNLNNFRFLRKQTNLSILTFEGFSENLSRSRSKITFCFYPEFRDAKIKHNGEESLRSQCYSFFDFEQQNFFSGLSKVLKIDHVYFWKKRVSQRIKIRFKIEDREDLIFEHGISNFDKHLSAFLSKNISKVKLNDKKMKLETLTKNDSPNDKIIDFSESSSVKKTIIKDLKVPIENTKIIKKPIKNKLHQLTADLKNKNQICLELCNIQKNSDLSIADKVKKCTRRAKFCEKMLKNDNLIALLKNIMNQAHEEERIHLTTELRRHLSNQQIICIFVHLCQYDSKDIPIQNIVDLIHLLFKLNLETQDNLDKEDSNFSIVTRNKNYDRSSLSLLSN